MPCRKEPVSSSLQIFLIHFLWQTHYMKRNRGRMCCFLLGDPKHVMQKWGLESILSLLVLFSSSEVALKPISLLSPYRTFFPEGGRGQVLLVLLSAAEGSWRWEEPPSILFMACQGWPAECLALEVLISVSGAPNETYLPVCVGKRD